jgi:hypothetical protein
MLGVFMVILEWKDAEVGLLLIKEKVVEDRMR